MSVPAGNDTEAFRRQRVRQYLRVGHDLPRVIAEVRLHGFAEAHRLGGDNVYEWPTLHAREDNFINRSGEVLLAQDHSRPRSP